MPSCYLCGNTYTVGSLSGHMRKGHSVLNVAERKHLLNLCNRRTHIRRCPCPVPACGALGKYLERHMERVHRGLGIEQLEVYKDIARILETNRLLQELRDSNPEVPLKTTWDDITNTLLKLDPVVFANQTARRDKPCYKPGCQVLQQRFLTLQRRWRRLKAEHQRAKRELWALRCSRPCGAPPPGLLLPPEAAGASGKRRRNGRNGRSAALPVPTSRDVSPKRNLPSLLLQREEPEPPRIKEEEEELLLQGLDEPGGDTADDTDDSDDWEEAGTGAVTGDRGFVTAPGSRNGRGGGKPFHCPFCRKGFRDVGAMEEHQRVHTGEEPFSCPLCDARFATARALMQHRRSHAGETPHRCAQCGESSAGTDEHGSGGGNAAGRNPLRCKHCNASFTLIEYLSQ